MQRPGQMKLQMEVAVACIVSTLWVQYVICDKLSGMPGTYKWKCACSSAHEGNQRDAVTYNCSTSRDCTCSPDSAGQSTEGRWTCLCAGEMPKVAGSDLGAINCFTACNCSSGHPNERKASRWHIAGKVVLIVLIVCVVLTTLAFLTSGCYVYQRHKSTVQPSISSDKGTSCNSVTNLISHRSILMPEVRVSIHSPVNSITGCVWRASFMSRSARRMIHGTITQFSYSELEYATSKFSSSNLVGLGGSSNVYCGQLKDGRTVAVKKLKTQVGPDADCLFFTEIELISRLHHCHVVPLIGYCLESQGKHVERLLVYEYMENGNLRDCLDGVPGKESMDWGTRIGIALGAARGLEYLHEAAAPRILHRDVKSTNILLDNKWRAKITDLGMAKHIRTGDLPSCSSSPAKVQGTFGYFAPEYTIVGRATCKSDVFSFGVVLLELITGRKPIHRSANKGEESLVIWATRILHDSWQVISELPDPCLKGNFPEEEMQIMAYLAKECLIWDPDSRPTMSEVVQILSTISPKKSTRQNLTLDLFQWSFNSSTEIGADIDRPDKRAEKLIDTEEPEHATSDKLSTRNSWPLTIDHAVCGGSSGKEDSLMSAEYTKRSILTSKARSKNDGDDEAVDLTEPRFESFRLPNVRSF